jgi:hypothetical protein
VETATAAHYRKFAHDAMLRACLNDGRAAAAVARAVAATSPRAARRAAAEAVEFAEIARGAADEAAFWAAGAVEAAR